MNSPELLREGNGLLEGLPTDSEGSLILPPERKPFDDALPQDWIVWQLADSAFPTGGFAHSAGLEAAWRQGEVQNSSELDAYVEANLQQCGRSSLPFMTASHRAPARLLEFDRLCESFLINHVANRASRAQGRALLTSVERTFGAGKACLDSIEDREQFYGHLAPIFGFISHSLGLEFPVACRLFIFLHLRGIISSSVRLGIIGPLEAQALQHRFAPRLERILRECQNLSLDEIAHVSPLLEIWQGAHDRLYSRLFQS